MLGKISLIKLRRATTDHILEATILEKQPVSIQSLIKKAVDSHGNETPRLQFLAENRYNKDMFPSTGQYDWFSGQVLYCLIRYLRPRRILEISTSCGYATMYMAMALKENSWGMIDTYEIEHKAAHAAQKLFNRYGLERFVNLKIGDARETSRNSPSDYGIYFLDSVHTEDFLRWFLEAHVLPAERIDSLFHMHDILPRSARVRRWSSPSCIYDGNNKNRMIEAPPKKRTGNFIQRLIHRQARNDEETIDLKVYPPANGQKLQTFDGNFTTEARFGNELVTRMHPWNYIFLYDLVKDYPQLTPDRYYATAIGRADARGCPMEWNEALWCQVTALKEAYRKLS